VWRRSLHHDRLVDVVPQTAGDVGAVQQAGAGKGAQQEDAVDELQRAAGEVELVAEPVDVEEGRGELVEDEGGCVVVDERSLRGYVSSGAFGVGLGGGKNLRSRSCRRLMR
jgi:hypothetical protein